MLGGESDDLPVRRNEDSLSLGMFHSRIIAVSQLRYFTQKVNLIVLCFSSSPFAAFHVDEYFYSA